MTPERFQRVASVFREASRLGGGERAAYLEGAGAGDPGLRREVERLLEIDDEGPGAAAAGSDGRAFPVPAPGPGPISTLADEPRIPAVMPERIGRYTLRQVLEEGGMGRVYVAVQAHPRRTVALKVMKSAIASRSALRRFEYESQILARLRHPNMEHQVVLGLLTHVAPNETGSHRYRGYAVPIATLADTWTTITDHCFFVPLHRSRADLIHLLEERAEQLLRGTRIHSASVVGFRAEKA